MKTGLGFSAATGAVAVMVVFAAACAPTDGGPRPSPTTPVSPTPTAPASSPPSIVLVTIDALRRDHLSFYGYNRPTTPFLADLAAEATVFTRAYSTSSWTVPALASMLTGVYPSTHGAIHGVDRQGTIAHQEILSSSLPNLVPALKNAGYTTYAVVANSHIDEGHGFAAGFDRFACVGFEPAERITDAISPWIGEISSATKPVFLWVHYFDPHQPTLAREPHFSTLLPDLSPTEKHSLAGLTNRAAIWGMISSGGRRGLELGLALYDSEIAHCDRHIAMLFEALPVLDDYLLVMTADHGEEFLDHGDLGHGFNVYDESIAIPLFVRPPGGGKHRTSNQLVSLVDLPPTLASVAAVEHDLTWQGHQIFDATGSPTPAPSRELIAELDRFRGLSFSTLISEKSKLIFKHDTSSIELYNLRTDPDELLNHASTAAPEAMEATVRRLQLRLAELKMQAPTLETAAVDPDTEQALKSLGYVDE